MGDDDEEDIGHHDGAQRRPDVQEHGAPPLNSWLRDRRKTDAIQGDDATAKAPSVAGRGASGTTES